MDIVKELKKQKEIELAEIKKDRNKGIPVRINPNSRVAKEVEYQTHLLKEIQKEINSTQTLIGATVRSQGNDKSSSSKEFAILKKKLNILMRIPSLNKFLLECFSNGEISINDMRFLNDLTPFNGDGKQVNIDYYVDDKKIGSY